MPVIKYYELTKSYTFIINDIFVDRDVSESVLDLTVRESVKNFIETFPDMFKREYPQYSGRVTHGRVMVTGMVIRPVHARYHDQVFVRVEVPVILDTFKDRSKVKRHLNVLKLKYENINISNLQVNLRVKRSNKDNHEY